MSLFALAYSNFKRSVREYRALVMALAFTVLIFFNFQNVIYSDSMDVLMTMNKEYIDIVVEAASLVFGVFLFFFIWYSTNVFLNQRKKEIGIYTFMGLDNVRIGKMYALEAAFIGLAALVLGLVLGIGFSKLFQMLLFWLSEIDGKVRFSFTLKPVLNTAILFLLIFFLMIGKGYVSIVRSSVLSLLSGAKQQEMKERNPILVGIQVIGGMLVLFAGFFAALKTGDIVSLGYALAAVVLVIVGVYLLFGGAIPVFLSHLTRKKSFLYKKQRTLWVNNLAYRVRQNYRTYAMVTVIMISSVTVLAMALAFKMRYDRLVHFQDTYTYQVVSMDGTLDDQEIRKGIEEENEVRYGSVLPCLFLDGQYVDGEYNFSKAGILSYSAVKRSAEETGLPFAYEELENGEAVLLSHVMIMSFGGNPVGKDFEINGETYRVIAEDSTAYLGDLQSQLDTYMVSDESYEKLKALGSEMYVYSYKIADPTNAEASMPYLHSLVKQVDGQYTVGVNKISSDRNDEAWIRIFYSLCVFMFLTLILAGGSIIFIKLGNDAYLDRQRYEVLKKLGISKATLYRSIKNEIRFTYYCPFLLMVIASFFSVKSLSNVMKEELYMVNIVSAVTVLILFSGIYLVSVRMFKRKVLD